VISVFKLEQIVREGDPVRRMLFIVRGHLQSSQALRTGATSQCTLGPGNFSGDELLSWCLRRPFLERLPASSSTLATLESTEAAGRRGRQVRDAPLPLHLHPGAEGLLWPTMARAIPKAQRNF